ncbi:MAG: PBP1A family penicillin-binding protein [Steroidobacteraceae bacterium]
MNALAAGRSYYAQSLGGPATLESPGPVNRRTRQRLFWACNIAVAAVGAFCLAALSVYYFLKPTLPEVDSLKNLQLQVPLRVYSRDGHLLGQIGEQRRVPVRFDEIPPVVVHAVLAAEDDRFFDHPGIDWQGMLRALMVYATTLDASQGGSTLTQQLVRTTLITRERKLRRKLREIFLSLQLETQLSKEEILTLFINTQFLGQRAYGFAAAAETYFGKRIGDLTVPEAALLAGILQAPSRFNPVSSPSAAAQRRAYVLRRMLELEYIDDATYQRALREPVSSELFGPHVEVDAPYVAELVRLALAKDYGQKLYSDGIRVVTTVESQMQRAADVALRSAVLEYDRRHGYRGPVTRAPALADAEAATVEEALSRFPVVGGLLPGVVIRVDAQSARVVTRSHGSFSVAWDAMKWARRSDATGTTGPSPKKPADVVSRGDVVRILPTGPGTALLAQLPAAQGAIVALDPNDGAILALSGGFDYYAASFNRVTQARRQPGSAFKPFIYSAALERGFTPASIILDAPVVFDSGEAGDWRPENNEGRFYGPTRLREALVRSRNLVSIRVMRSLGVAYTLDYVQRFGFPPKHLPRDLTAALGTAQLSPLEVATGYAVFANGGYRVEPYLIDRVENARGEVVMRAEAKLVCRECTGAQTAAGRAGELSGTAQSPSLIAAGAGDKSVLGMEEVAGSMPLVDPGHRAPAVISPANAFIMTDMMRDVIRRGTARRALALKRDDLAGKTGTTNDRRDAWFSGFNTDIVATVWVGFDQERSLGDNEEGSRTALPMWIQFMREALSGHAEHRLPMPEGVVTARIQPGSGRLAAADDPDAVFEYFLSDRLPGGAGGTSAEGDDTGQRDDESLF